MDGAVVVEKSTVPAGTAERVRLTLQREGTGRQVHVASNPEFLREGLALRDALEPDRVVIGVASDVSRKALERLYAPMIGAGTRFVFTDVASAELAKHATNSFLALKISFANALARMCERSGADVTVVADVMGFDARIGRAFLDAGIGFGGYCLPKDVAALERLGAQLGYPFPMLHEVNRVNAEAVDAVAARVEEAVWNIEGKRIAIWGLAFKPDTDDVRSSPALALAERLIEGGAHVTAFDPKAASPARDELPALRVANSAFDAASGAHCLVVATDWDEFRQVDLQKLRTLMAHPVVVDGRNLFDPDAMRETGFWYYPTGRPAVIQSAHPSAEPVDNHSSFISIRTAPVEQRVQA
jgi:UDPglucose 6-dehydrogenase